MPGQCRDHLICSYWQEHSDWRFQQVTSPYTSARVHLYAPGLLYRLLYPALIDRPRVADSSRSSKLASVPSPQRQAAMAECY